MERADYMSDSYDCMTDLVLILNVSDQRVVYNDQKYDFTNFLHMSDNSKME